MNILVLNTKILAVNPQDIGDAWQTADQVIPKHVVPGAALVTVDSLPADYAPGRYTYDNGFIPAPLDSGVLAAQKSDLITKIDADIDSIVTKVVGRRETEYLKAEEQALAYIAANYTGAVPAFVQSWATAKNQTATWAADDIAATAAAWRAAQAIMRENRLQHKEDARNAADAAALSLVETSWNTFVAAIKTQLEIS